MIKRILILFIFGVVFVHSDQNVMWKDVFERGREFVVKSTKGAKCVATKVKHDVLNIFPMDGRDHDGQRIGIRSDVVPIAVASGLLIEKGAGPLLSSLKRFSLLSPKNYAQYGQQLSAIVRNIADHPHTHHVIAYGPILYWSTKTVQLAIDLASFEDYFQRAGIFRGEVEKKILTMKADLDEIILLLQGVSHTNVMNVKVRTDGNLSNATLWFEEKQNTLAQELVGMKHQVLEYHTKLEKQQKQMKQKRNDAIKHMGLSALWAVGTLSASAVFPTTIPTLFSVNAGTVVSGFVSGINGLAAVFAEKYIQKVDFRISEFHNLKQELQIFETKLSGYLSKFHQKLQQQEKLFQLQEKLRILDGFQVKTAISILTGLLFIGCVLIAFFRKSRRASPSLYLKWLVSLSLCCIFVIFLMEWYCNVQRDIIISTESRVHAASIEIQNARNQYRHECIWYEIPISRQLALQTRAYFASLFGYDGQRSLSMNSRGELVSDIQCQNLLEIINSDAKSRMSHVEAQTHAYLRVFVSIGNTIGHIFEAFIQSTSWTAKGCFALFLVLLSFCYWLTQELDSLKKWSF